MKFNSFTKYMLVILPFFMLSCSSSSSSGDDVVEDKATSISIAVDKTVADIGETFTFSVKDNLGNVVTAQSSIYFNDVSISGNTYTASEDGTFKAYATYNGLTSSKLNVKVNEAAAVLTSLILKVDNDEILLGDTVTFTVKGNDGSTLTDEATYYVNGTEITGNSYVSTSRGIEKYTAKYNDITSNELSVLVGHKQKVLIEDYTGAWCGYCPRVAWGIELVLDETSDAIPVAIHRGNTDPTAGSHDPYNYPASDLEDYIGLSGYPTAMLNRKTSWTYPEPSNVSQITNMLATFNKPKVTNIGLSVATVLSGDKLDITIGSSVLNENQTLDGEKLVVYILENGLVYDQQNYTEYYGGVAVIKDFVHDNVLRQVPTDIFGDAIEASQFDSDKNSYQKTFSVDLTSNIEDKTKLSVVAFIVDSNGNTKNVQHATVGIDKDFD
ncbi:Outer membrane protein Omp28 [Lutibacter oricola]|uniref:Outer membrane protein Omp28 n=1 Tax=Lutibacter oricola TaxID=762486 RepID=A0A1H2SXM3_9FLAO|nr:Omp28-related outer membrane protein [Lutibacter oricola]SDW36330.1 Outer membrane protein Omp28 [Lutibacter oricola]